MLHSTGEASAAPAETAPALALARELVDEDELIILMLRPSLWFVLLSSLRALALIGLLTFALAYTARVTWMGWNDTQAFALGAGLAALRLGWQMIEWMGRVYILTDRRIITRSGVLHVTIFHAPLRNIQHTALFVRLRERLLGLGTIAFATAGSDTFESLWLMVPDPHAIHRTVNDAIKRYGRG